MSGTSSDRRRLAKENFEDPQPNPDTFSSHKLEAFLSEHQVNDLYLVGLDAEFCVHSTAKGALKRRYNVNIITDCIALRAEKKWDDLINKYKKDGINLIASRDF